MQQAAARLACGQGYAADAHVNLYYLADLAPIIERYGNRGYRLAQLEAALFAGKLHLAAHALGFGAVGSTAVDDEVIRSFSLTPTARAICLSSCSASAFPGGLVAAEWAVYHRVGVAFGPIRASATSARRSRRYLPCRDVVATAGSR